jgi:large subunit ribosomal protein L5
MFSYRPSQEIPKVVKICLNRGNAAGVGASDARSSAAELSLITGQVPYLRKARKSIAGFKVREGNSVGLAITLRGARMYSFLARLVHIVLPRVRDFRGLDWKRFDRSGNYNFGIDDQLVFPELSYEDVTKARGVGLSLVTSAPSDEEACFLLSGLGMVFDESALCSPRPGWVGSELIPAASELGPQSRHLCAYYGPAAALLTETVGEEKAKLFLEMKLKRMHCFADIFFRRLRSPEIDSADLPWQEELDCLDFRELLSLSPLQQLVYRISDDGPPGAPKEVRLPLLGYLRSLGRCRPEEGLIPIPFI